VRSPETSQPDPHALALRAHAAETIARRAGRVVLGHLGRLDGYGEKSPIDLVTIADRESEVLVAEALQALFPDDLRILEEQDGFAGARARRDAVAAADFAWFVDPLDGTTNFVHGFPLFAVALGLTFRGRVVFGVVHAPALDETYVGGLGHAATLNGKPIRVSTVPTMSRALVATGFPYDRRERLDALLEPVRRVILAAHDVRRAGAATLDLCGVAAGRFDAFFEEGLSPWDVVAGQAIVEAAGGRVSAYDRGPHDVYGRNVLASNGALHDALASLVRP
jgi:myo-inositol-1(or 4)-monophosphatase